MSNIEDEPGLSLDSIFEPERPPSPDPTFSTYTRKRALNKFDWETIEIRLVGSHPLWGHYLKVTHIPSFSWNASRSFASYLDEHQELYHDRCVLELGAGGGLPGIVAVKNGARKVVLTDYPDTALIDNLAYNVERNTDSTARSKADVQGYIWGHAVAPLLSPLQDTSKTSASQQKFDLIIMSDLVFNHSQHDALLKTCALCLSSTPSPPPVDMSPCLIVFYTHHRPHLAERDLDFFRKAHDQGWTCEEIITERFPPMFPDDPGDEEVRATVHGWKLTRHAP
ncbi:hypothetical protein HETIRDRAFT_105796 [Heterobasidion irregulare TC 32-1]|uniref:Elongation factor methyltransferase 7 n=1 Tax=Heterobasidion irregulare (strain TC 32-1) TaxID=747525 RepID=W4JTV8_HETIT|nr:uncharacterized protein HETIRDRAFT_105796 [Heterobasidion irregulare TC 32-1]ETW76291.1 hypothetical protein HETIRDRAFT_105796 [Heterobasidion irregulare TC 32-1]